MKRTATLQGGILSNNLSRARTFRLLPVSVLNGMPRLCDDEYSGTKPYGGGSSRTLLTNFTYIDLLLCHICNCMYRDEVVCLDIFHHEANQKQHFKWL